MKRIKNDEMNSRSSGLLRKGSLKVVCIFQLSGMCSLLLLFGHVSKAQPAGPFGGPPGRGPGGGNQQREIVDQFDMDGDGRLNAEERAQAVEFMKANPQGRGGGGPRFRGPGDGRGPGRGPGGFRGPGRRGGPGGPGGPGGMGPGGRGGRGEIRPLATKGISLTPDDVKHYPDAPLYDASVLRTFFIDFENPDWEAEMVAFNNTDVDVPAKVTVDGKVYPDVGIHFRGNSSFGVGDGYKRSLNLSFDFVHQGQSVHGYRTLNFLNANEDPTFLHTVLSLRIAREYIPAPKANLVRVVINGENWGIYANQQQFNKDFLQDFFDTKKGTRWKVPQGGARNGIGAFRYAGDDVDAYRNVFQIKSKDKPEAWQAIIGLAETLDQTPLEVLESALADKLDVDSYLRFLALDNALVSGDGFWTRGADYTIYLDPDGRFHFVPYDMNEMFSSHGGGRGPGGGGGNYQGGIGVELEPLAGLSDPEKPIIYQLLSVPSLQEKYLGYVRAIAENHLDWNTIGPWVNQYRELIQEDVQRDTRKLFTTEAFLSGTADVSSGESLRAFFDQRRAFLLKHKDLQ
jgi:hypothetical protein